MTDRAAITVLATLGSLLGHAGGDYLVQNDCMAAHKQKHTPEGRKALAAHAASYAVTQAVTKAVFYRTAGVRVPLAAQLAGAVVEGVLHAVIDDGRLLKRFSRICPRRNAAGEMVGRQQGFHDNVPGGRALMDQAVHHQLQIPAGVVATVAVAALLARRGR